jgi:hypothetical protein
MTRRQERVVALLISILWVPSAAALDTAQDVMLRVQRQVSAPVETARGEMKLYIYGDFHRHYTFVLGNCSISPGKQAVIQQLRTKCG